MMMTTQEMTREEKKSFYEESIRQISAQMSTLRVMMQNERGLDYDWHEQTLMTLRKVRGFYEVDLHLLEKNQT